jgi:hypothetical protein
MRQTVKAGDAQAVIEQHLQDIDQWKAEGISQREMARRLNVPDSSFRDAYKRLSKPVHADRLTHVYEGIPASQPEAVKVVFEEARSLLPTLREMVQSWDVLREMMTEYSHRQQLLEVAPQYKTYEGFYSCRLSNRLIQDIKKYAADHRLSQSELVTVALQAYMQGS